MPAYTPLQQHAYDYIKDLIISEKLDQEQVYSEAYFARTLHISRTPVRDALQRLCQEEYVDILPSRGFIIHPLTRADVVAMYQMRCAIEGYCLTNYASLAGSPETAGLLSKLEENIARQKSCLDTEDAHETYFNYDCEFHRLIVSQLGNHWFDEAFQKYIRQLQMMTKMTMTATERIQRSIQEHEAICRIIREGRKGEVAGWMHQHIDFPTRYTLELVKQPG